MKITITNYDLYKDLIVCYIIENEDLYDVFSPISILPL